MTGLVEIVASRHYMQIDHCKEEHLIVQGLLKVQRRGGLQEVSPATKRDRVLIVLFSFPMICAFGRGCVGGGGGEIFGCTFSMAG